MPIDYSKYPPNWKTEIRPAILERDGHRCKFCGVPNYAIIRIHPFSVQGLPLADIIDKPPFTELKAMMGEGGSMKITDKEASRFCLENMKQGMDFKVGGFKYTRVVLTIAHLDHDITNNDYNNLAALCQKCHNRHDRPHRDKNAKATNEAKKKAETGQLELPL